VDAAGELAQFVEGGGDFVGQSVEPRRQLDRFGWHRRLRHSQMQSQ
jgi:hypothetical protein